MLNCKAPELPEDMAKTLVKEVAKLSKKVASGTAFLKTLCRGELTQKEEINNCSFSNVTRPITFHRSKCSTGALASIFR